MQHIITDEEITRFREVYTDHSINMFDSYRAALADFLTNRPESMLGKLRPIAEMSETVPEGCVRMFVYRHASGCFGGPFFIHSTGDRFNFFADIQLPTPDPEAEERKRFEEAIQSDEEFRGSHLEWKDGEYVCKAVRNAFAGWKLRSKLAKAK